MTPNSFSDQGKSLNPEIAIAQLQSFLENKKVIPDIGFESTAPMNSAIALEEEWRRFENFLHVIKDIDLSESILSLDTYKIENFIKMTKELKSTFKVQHVVFNDVSGCLDADLSRAMDQEDFTYIYTFSHIPSRAEVLNHMNYLSEKDVVHECAEAFKKAIEFFKQKGKLDRLILDPGFGFSKTYEQNWDLINRAPELMELLANEKITNPILIGLSKKSFLRKALKTESFSESEKLHLNCLVDILKATKHPILFRVHDPKIVELAKTLI
jgi:dihydropteroate synthase